MFEWNGKIQLVVGGLFYFFLALMGYNTIVQKNRESLQEPMLVPVKLATAENLKVGARVYVLGVPAGFVGSLHYITLDQRSKPIPVAEREKTTPASQYVMAVLELDREFAFYPDYKIFTKNMEILGEKSVEVDPGHTTSLKGEEWSYLTLQQGEALALRQFEDFSPLLRNGNLLFARNWDDPLYQVAVVLGENRGSFRRITRNLSEITSKLNTGHGNLALLLNRPVLHNSMGSLLHEGIVLVEETRQDLEVIRETDAYTDFLGAFLLMLWDYSNSAN